MARLSCFVVPCITYVATVCEEVSAFTTRSYLAFVCRILGPFLCFRGLGGLVASTAVALSCSPRLVSMGRRRALLVGRSLSIDVFGVNEVSREMGRHGLT